MTATAIQIPSYAYKEKLLDIQGVSLSFGEKRVLSGITAEVNNIVRPDCNQGQVVAILGPSGSGKTVFSRILAGLQTPTSGVVKVGPTGDPVRAGLVGYVPQNYTLLRHRTVEGNLAKAARSAGHSAAEAHTLAFEYLERFDLKDKWDAYPAELSGGQRQRIAIAQQLLCSEHYLILDEPTSGLDPIMKDKVIELVRKVSLMHEENTIFIVSHDIPSVVSVADHIWLIGRTRDEKGDSLGSNIRYQHDLIERGIAWQDKPTSLPQFTEVVREIRAQFETL